MKRPSVSTDRSLPEILVIALTVAVFASLVIAASVSGAAFGVFTPTWEGTSDLRSTADDTGAETVIVTDTAGYETEEAERTVAVILSPEYPYDDTEAERIASFVESGGTLVVADSSGQHTNPLLDAVGASSRIDGDLLRDEREYYRSPALPVTTPTSAHPYVADADGLTLNYGSALSAGDANVLVRSSEYGYLDRDASGNLTDGDEMAAHPIVTLEQVGDGEVVVVSDASVFINTMLEHDGNRGLATGLFSTHDRVLFDVSHSGEIPPLTAAVLALRGTPLLGAAIGLTLVTAIGLAYRRPAWARGLLGRATDVGSRAGLDEREMHAELETRHPDWGAEKRERVVTAVISHREGDRDNE